MPLFIIIYNFRGVGFLLLGGAVFGIGSAALPASVPEAVPAVLAGLVVIGADAMYRLKFRDLEGMGCLVYPTCGGHLWFIPLWAIGVIAMLAALFGEQGDGARRRPARPPVSAGASAPVRR